MEKFCRLCLKYLSGDDSVSVFGEGSEDISEMIFVCTSISVKQEDKQPNSVCVQCSEALIQCNDFREKCRKADRVLVKYWECQSKDSSSSPSVFLEALESASLLKNDYSEFLEIALKNNLENKAHPEDENILSYPIVVTEATKVNEITNVSNKKEVFIKKKKKKRRKSLETVRETKPQPDSKKKTTSFTCEFCNKIYPSEGGWRYHVHTMHSQTYQPFICDLCGKAFKAKKNMEVHKRSVHFKVKENLCDVCGVKFATKYGLRVHQVWHTGEKKYECKVCEARFASNGKLNTHLIIHEGFKKFMCDVCSRVFRWKKDFVVHMRTHTGEKPYSCKICNKAFASLTNKRKHESNHANSKKPVGLQNVPLKILNEPVKPETTSL